jgi:hypothetical protein
MKAGWHRSEPRDVRPFFGVVRAEEAVSKATIRLFDGGSPAHVDTTSFDLDDIDIARLEPAVFPELAPVANWIADGYEPGDFELLVLASNMFLKNSVVVKRFSLAASVPREVPVPREVIEELGGGRNLVLTVAVCLASDREPTPGLPFVKGHWLSKREFTIRGKTNPSFFDIRMRSDAEWVEAGFPPKTLYSVDYIGAIAEPNDETSNVATVWFHADAYNAMVNEAIGEAIQPVLGAEIIAQILEASAQEWAELDTPPAGSPLATVVKRLAAGSSISLAEVRRMTEGSGRSRLRALLQDALGAVRAVV